MKKNKITGWTILCLHAIILLLIFQFDILGNWNYGSITASIFTMYSLVITSLAWHLINKKGKSHNK
jgi:hypothetical protein